MNDLSLSLQPVLSNIQQQYPLSIASVFSNHMVLQRDEVVRVWGKAAPNEIITLSFNHHQITCTANAAGDWQLALPPMNTIKIGQPFVVKGEHQSLCLDNVVVGEVWVCSGQSNMGWTLDLSQDAELHIANAINPMIRFLVVPTHRSHTPESAIQESSWAASHPDHARHWSAVGYHFASKLYRELEVPIGIIWASLGATKIQEWTSEEINSLHNYDVPEEWNDNQPSSLFNGMIAPLIPYTIRGVAWYQGEENHWGAGLYQTQQSAMIEDWRNRWQQGSFPFVYTQLANYGKTHSEPWSAWAELQEAQLRSLDHPNTAMAVAIDVGEADDIHPRNKQPVGERLAIAALGKFYHKDIVYSGPLYRDYKIEGNKIRIYFDHVGDGLISLDGQALRWFEIADPHPIPGRQLRFSPANAEIDGDSILVSHPEKSQPVAARYAFNNNPEGCNLGNSAGLPASPFRTSNDWSATLGNNPKREAIAQRPVAIHEKILTKNTTTPIELKLALSRTNPAKSIEFEILAPPKHGKLTGQAPQIMYTPEPNFIGEDCLLFRVKNDGLESNVASVIISVQSAPHP